MNESMGEAGAGELPPIDLAALPELTAEQVLAWRAAMLPSVPSVPTVPTVPAGTDTADGAGGDEGEGEGGSDPAGALLAAAASGKPGARQLSLIEALTLLTSAVSARQAVAAAEVAVEVGADLAARNQPTQRITSAIGARVALARHQSPHRGSAFVKAAQDLTTTLPHTLAALLDGTISERHATLVAAKASWLTDDQQRELDAQVASQLGGLSEQRAADAAGGIASRLDPKGATERARNAVKDRTVTIRPAPDTMSYLSGLLPVADGVAAYASLKLHADACRFAGDDRTPGQIMADEFVARITGRSAGVTADGAPTATIPAHTIPGTTPTSPAGTNTTSPTGAGETTSTSTKPAPANATGTNTTNATATATDSGAADAGAGAGAGRRGDDLADLLGLAAAAEDESRIGNGGLGRSLEIMMIMTDRTLLDGDDAPAHLIGYGNVPAPLARALAVGDGYDKVRIRRLFTDPLGRLVAMETTSRVFTDGMKQFLLARDHRCRTPWCNATIAHADHTKTNAAGGPTTRPNGNGRCARCNYDKAVNDQVETTTDDGHTITITMPTGHTYTTTAPPPPKSASWTHSTYSRVELDLAHRIRNLEYTAAAA